MARLEESIREAFDVGEQLRVVRAVATAGSGAGRSRRGLLFGFGGQTLADAGSDWHGSIRLDRRTNILVITDRRVILGETKLGRFSAVLTEVPRSLVASITGQKAKLAIGKLVLTLATGEQMVLDLASDRGLDRFLADANGALQP